MDQEPSRQTSAGIVIFHPDEDQLVRLVATVAPGLREVVVFANSEVTGALETELAAAAAPTSCAVLRPGANVGLGAAYDAFVERARSAGDRFVFLLDQDSMPPGGAVGALSTLHDRLANAGERPAIVGPRPLDPQGRPMKIAATGTTTPVMLALEATRVSFVISSGSLVDVATAEAVGSFRSDFFIDAIDLEWCFRANARGFSIWVAEQVRMDHRLGRGVIRIPILGLLLADQPPRRLYTFLRNQIAMLRLPHVPTAHKAKTLLSLPLRLPVYLVRNGFSGECRAAIRNGLRDGFAGRLGPPDGAFR
jgi:rhamnosyltransferase